jgi:hypothetical protein
VEKEEKCPLLYSIVISVQSLFIYSFIIQLNLAADFRDNLAGVPPNFWVNKSGLAQRAVASLQLPN